MPEKSSIIVKDRLLIRETLIISSLRMERKFPNDVGKPPELGAAARERARASEVSQSSLRGLWAGGQVKH